MITTIEIFIYIGIFFALYFSVFILTTAIENKKRAYLKPTKQSFPLVSLVVPCFNEAHNVDLVVQSLLNLNYPKKQLEIIIIDDGSKDTTFEKAKTWQKKYPAIIKTFSKPNGGKHTALNLGFSEAKGIIVGCVDADCAVEKNAILRMVNHFQDRETAIVVSTIKILNPKNILEGIQYVEYIISAFFKKVFGFLGSISVTSGPLTLFRASALKELGPYKKAHQTEDLEIAFRAQSKNMKIDYALNAIVYTYGEKTMKGLTKQRLRWRRGFLLNLRDYPGLLNLKKHGNLAFCLTYNAFGILISVSITAYSLFRLFSFVLLKINQAMLISFDFNPYLADFRFVLPHFNPKPTLILSSLCLAAMLGFLLWGKKLTLDTTRLKEKALFYVIFYAFFNAMWWVMAGWSAIFKKELVWN
ncbi:MAG: glycosyltransferase family 2 protein [bacterium]|nr:glycosyltransferase family 2 protein [bacterium]